MSVLFKHVNTRSLWEQQMRIWDSMFRNQWTDSMSVLLKNMLRMRTRKAMKIFMNHKNHENHDPDSLRGIYSRLYDNSWVDSRFTSLKSYKKSRYKGCVVRECEGQLFYNRREIDLPCRTQIVRIIHKLWTLTLPYLSI